MVSLFSIKMAINTSRPSIGHLHRLELKITLPGVLDICCLPNQLRNKQNVL